MVNWKDEGGRGMWSGLIVFSKTSPFDSLVARLGIEETTVIHSELLNHSRDAEEGARVAEGW
jgi:hypothetical protein